jgi:hypothetical protein
MTGAYLEYNSAKKRINGKCGWIFASFIPDVMEFTQSNAGAKSQKLRLGLLGWNRASARP